METIEYKGYKIEIEQDMNPCDPIAEWDGNARYALSHGRFNLQNDTDLSTDDYGGWDEFEKALKKKYKALAILPVYMYNHSGITINTTGFSCRWDSGQIGFVFVNKECLNEWGYKSVRGYEKASGRTIQEDMISNVNLYDTYLRGDVYGYRVIDSDGDEIDSCWGYYGDSGIKEAIEQGKGIIDFEIKEKKDLVKSN